MPSDSVVERKLMNAFAEVASSVGYSEIHGRILAVLLIEQEPVPLQSIAKKLSYSLASISLSADLLDTLGIVRKFRKPSDRKVYLELKPNFFENAKRAVLGKWSRTINDSMLDFEKEKKGVRSRKLSVAIASVEREIVKLKKLLDLAGSLVWK